MIKEEVWNYKKNDLLRKNFSRAKYKIYRIMDSCKVNIPLLCIFFSKSIHILCLGCLLLSLTTLFLRNLHDETPLLLYGKWDCGRRRGGPVKISPICCRFQIDLAFKQDQGHQQICPIQTWRLISIFHHGLRHITLYLI